MENYKQSSASAVFLKEPKLEIQEDRQKLSTVKGVNFLDKVPKKEGSAVSIGSRTVSYNDKVIKQEINNDEEYNLDTPIPIINDYGIKKELVDVVEEYDYFKENENNRNMPNTSIERKSHFIKKEPRAEPSDPQSALIWRPDIESLSDYWSNIDDTKLGMELGTSILFNKPASRSPPKKKAKQDVPHFQSEKKKLAEIKRIETGMPHALQIRRKLGALYSNGKRYDENSAWTRQEVQTLAGNLKTDENNIADWLVKRNIPVEGKSDLTKPIKSEK